MATILAPADAAVVKRPKGKLDVGFLLNMRLYPDMFPLTRQVQIACDVAKGCGARLAGVEIPKFEDNEVTIADYGRPDAPTPILGDGFAWGSATVAP